MGNIIINKRMEKIKMYVSYDEYVALRGFSTIGEFREVYKMPGEEDKRSIEDIIYKDFKNEV